jgi:hypothetical protein
VILRGYRLGALYGPQPCYINDVLAFRVLMGGFLLIYFVSPEPFNPEITSRFLTCGGSVVVEEKEIHQIPLLNSLAAKIAKEDR